MAELPPIEVQPNPNGATVARRQDGADARPQGQVQTPAELAKHTGELLLDCATSIIQGARDAVRRYSEALSTFKDLCDADKSKVTRYARLLGAGTEFMSADTPERREYAKELKELGLSDNLSSFQIREGAQRAIMKMGPAACPCIEKELQNDDPEIRMRARNILNSNVNGGGLMPIEREPNRNSNIGGMIGALLMGAAGVLGGQGGETRQQIQFKVDETRKFADDPQRTAKRIEQVDQILAQNVLGKLNLSPETAQYLRGERKNLKQIGPLCAALEIDLAHSAIADGDHEAAKKALNSAFKHDNNALKKDEVINIIVANDFDKNDAQFMEQFAKAGGDAKLVTKVRAERGKQQILPWFHRSGDQ